MKNTKCARWQRASSGRPVSRIVQILALFAIFGISEIFASAAVGDGVLATSFDTSGTISEVLTPSKVLIGNEEVNLEGVDTSDLNSGSYAYLMSDLKDWLTGKDVFVRGNHVYFNLNGAYNSVSINEMIQSEIADLLYEQYYDECCHCNLC